MILDCSFVVAQLIQVGLGSPDSRSVKSAMALLRRDLPFSMSGLALLIFYHQEGKTCFAIVK
jgi:hypothetical protein